MGAWAPRGRPRKRAGCWSVMMSIKSWVAWPGAPIALASAALFSASTPLAKALLGGGISPWLLAGLLYLGSGMGLALITVLRRRSEEHTSELQSLMRISYAVFCLKKKNRITSQTIRRRKTEPT